MLWALGIFGALVVFWLVSRSLKYAKVFSDAHVAELAAAAPRIKEAALRLADGPMPSSAEDPRGFVTSAGLAVVYTVRRDGARLIHHCSVSLTQGFTPRAVGSRFIGECVRLFGFPPDATQYEVGASTVHHAEAVISDRPGETRTDT